ncbi:hypothetical protein PROFUN_11941 [Planoprotostelium fungivorum]|uniref:Uncharacterized protein n=1 Tax=Planoprotostelium fungivorum TaxID=1890364 RepID=A0A2P6N8X3_9EUKA|nr:hypothetical protein PROFUN_11941 [Planoprotostelium fungivorum]
MLPPFLDLGQQLCDRWALDGFYPCGSENLPGLGHAQFLPQRKQLVAHHHDCNNFREAEDMGRPLDGLKSAEVLQKDHVSFVERDEHLLGLNSIGDDCLLATEITGVTRSKDDEIEVLSLFLFRHQ